MASSSQLLLLWLLLLNVSSVSTDSNQHSITAESGQNIILPCRVSDNSPVLVVEWTRNDLDSYSVLLFRDSQFDSEHQHPSFKDRVDLRDRQMKKGDTSLVLRHMTTDDSGTYECRVVLTGATRNLVGAPDSIINLTVTPESRMVSSRGSRAGSSGPVIGLAVLLLLLLLFTD